MTYDVVSSEILEEDRETANHDGHWSNMPSSLGNDPRVKVVSSLEQNSNLEIVGMSLCEPCIGNL